MFNVVIAAVGLQYNGGGNVSLAIHLLNSIVRFKFPACSFDVPGQSSALS